MVALRSVAGLQDQGLGARSGEICRGDQPVVATADYERVVFDMSPTFASIGVLTDCSI